MKYQLSATPLAMLSCLFQNRELLHGLVKRDFFGRYKGSILGVLWAIFNPLFLLAIYTFVFSVAFKAKWGGGEETKVTFAIVLFSGMIVHSFFSECLNRAPSLIVGSSNYVKKVVFPLDILPVMVLFSALINFLVGFSVLLVFCLLAGVVVHVGTLLIPVVLIPLILMTLGFTWILSALGVYLRDISQFIGVLTTVALFLAPIFYPIDALPKSYQALLLWNPITLPVVQLRNLMLWGESLRWDAWVISLVIGSSICCLGYWWFQKTRRGFSDVL